MHPVSAVGTKRGTDGRRSSHEEVEMTDATGVAIRGRGGSAWFALAMVTALLSLPAAAGAARGAAGTIELVTDHARVEVIASNGSEASPVLRAEPVVEEATDFSAFAETVHTIDDSSSDRASEAQASQDTIVDDTEGRLWVETEGSADANGFDQQPAVGAGPNAQALSELSVTFEVTDASTVFSLGGAISAEVDGANDGCTAVTVESPSGEVFEVAAPSTCGGPAGTSIQDGGTLAPGTYTFSIQGGAEVLNPDGEVSIASASFDVGLFVGNCTIVGTSGDDALTGTGGDDIICGLGGRDSIRGGDGDDVIFGDAGNDAELNGGPGNDQIFGGPGADNPIVGEAGNDLLYGEGGRDGIAGGLGNDIIDGGEGRDFLYGDEVEGCEGALSDPGLDDDEIFGGGGNDDIAGCQGLDKLHGDAGDDRIDGNTGNDVLLGHQGSDKLRGQQGSDTLTGGPRKDVLLGGQADDVIFARDGVSDEVGGGPGSNDQAQIDEDLIEGDVVSGIEVFLA
jgi:Ca2+-binding RTX toxin-like protein